MRHVKGEERWATNVRQVEGSWVDRKTEELGGGGGQTVGGMDNGGVLILVVKVQA